MVAAAEERRVTSLSQAPPDQIGRGFLVNRYQSNFGSTDLLEAVSSLPGASRKESPEPHIAPGLRSVRRVVQNRAAIKEWLRPSPSCPSSRPAIMPGEHPRPAAGRIRGRVAGWYRNISPYRCAITIRGQALGIARTGGPINTCLPGFGDPIRCARASSRTDLARAESSRSQPDQP